MGHTGVSWRVLGPFDVAYAAGCTRRSGRRGDIPYYCRGVRSVRADWRTGVCVECADGPSSGGPPMCFWVCGDIVTGVFAVLGGRNHGPGTRAAGVLDGWRAAGWCDRW